MIEHSVLDPCILGAKKKCVSDEEEEEEIEDQNQLTTTSIISLPNPMPLQQCQDHQQCQVASHAILLDQHHQHARDLKDLYSLIKLIRRLRLVKGYLFAIAWALFACVALVLIKATASSGLDGSIHAIFRYALQLAVMTCVIRSNNLQHFGPREHRLLLTCLGVIGCGGVLVGFFSVSFLEVSDVETLLNSCVIITAVIARLVLKEKLILCHLVSMCLNIAGVLFILRPNQLFGSKTEEKQQHNFIINETVWRNARQVLNYGNNGGNNGSLVFNNDTKVNHLHNHYDGSTPTLAPSFLSSWGLKIGESQFDTMMGVALVLTSATSQSIAQVMIRKLSLAKIHFSLMVAYPAYIGLPASILVSVLLRLYRMSLPSHSNKNTSFSNSSSSFCSFLSDVQAEHWLMAFGSGLCGCVGVICLNKALQYEDPTKVGMIKMSGVFFSFLFQYVFLDVGVDLLAVLGAVCVLSGVGLVMTIKLYERKLNSKRKQKGSSELNLCMRLLTIRL